MKLKFEFEISEPAFELLKKIQEVGYAEYRDIEFENLVQFKCTVQPEYRLTEEQFLERNFGGTYDLIPELLQFNLVESDSMAWHSTYKLTDIGEAVLFQN